MATLIPDLDLRMQLLEAQSEASIDGILVVDPNGKIISYNERFVELWQIPENVVASKSDEAALNSVLSKLANPAEFLERVKYLYSHADEKGTEEVPLSDGRVFERYSTAVRDRHGIVYGRIWFFRDITDRILAQKKISEQQQMIIQSSKMSALGEMAGGVAHEINTPLAVIGLKIEQMEQALRQGHTEARELLAALDILKRTTDRIAKIVSGLRFFARDGRDAPKEEVLVESLLAETLSLCQERFLSHGVKIEINWKAEKEKLSLECRPVEISQVILNLLNNSFDAIIHSENKWIRIDIIDQGPQITISITDSGPGIPPQIRNRIMDPFFTTKAIGKGTGLGLSISKGIVEAHQGQLIYDVDCANTRFMMTLPKHQTVVANDKTLFTLKMKP